MAGVLFGLATKTCGSHSSVKHSRYTPPTGRIKHTTVLASINQDDDLGLELTYKLRHQKQYFIPDEDLENMEG